MKLLLGLVASFFIWFGPLLSADVDAAKQRLLQLDYRPTMVDLVRELDPMPPHNPFQKLVEDPFIGHLANSHKFIVELEHAYPGATWAVLGRDSSLSADVLETFYMKIGQKERVIRLNASARSFGDDLRFQQPFLFTEGLVDASGYPIKKFVILDSTKWEKTSQTRRLILSVYQNIPKKNQRAFLPFINVINIASHGQYINIGTPIVPALDLFKFWHDSPMENDIPTSITHANGLTYLPGKIIQVPGPIAGKYIDKLVDIVWHDRFLPFREQGNGTVVAPRGELSCAKDREHVLWWMYEVYQFVYADAFVDNVQKIARNEFGYDFFYAIKLYRTNLNQSVNAAVDQFRKTSNLTKIRLFINILEAFSSNLPSPLTGFAHEDLFVAEIKRLEGAQSPLLNYFVSAHPLLHTSTVAEYIQVAKTIPKNQKKLLFRESLDHFLSLEPAVEQVNQVIAMLRKNGTTHQMLASKALARIDNLRDYNTLNKPSRLFNKPVFQAANKKFKETYPGYFKKHTTAHKLRITWAKQ